MKRLYILVLVLAFSVVLGSCGGRSIADLERDAREEAKKELYREGIETAQQTIDDRVTDELHSLEFDIKERYGIFAEDAVQILEHYLDGGEVSESELRIAIAALSKYYHKSIDIMTEIDDYWIE